MKNQDPSIDRRNLLVTGAMVFGGWALIGRDAKASGARADKGSPAGSRTRSTTSLRSLVLIELSGGNDGLSTVVPWADDVYHRSRPRTRIASDEVLKIDDYRGLHPELAGLRGVFDDGRMAIVEGVGYPGANLSHFTAQDVWHTARIGGRSTGDGWIGRLRDVVQPEDDHAPFALHTHDEKPHALKCSKRPLMTPAHREDVTSTLRTYRARADYPRTRLGADLRSAAALLQSDIGCRVIHVAHTGYDTHEDQRRRHDQKMRELDGALCAFLADLRGTPAGDECVVLVHSEFGRSLAENDTLGTEHGTAGPVFLVGSPVRGGIFGRHPDLARPDERGLIHTTDFRSIYASVLERGFGVDSRPILGENYAHVTGCFV
jgi:uncharacterized protein (DUF1501 family)